MQADGRKVRSQNRKLANKSIKTEAEYVETMVLLDSLKALSANLCKQIAAGLFLRQKMKNLQQCPAGG